jgi:hypothetical protein
MSYSFTRRGEGEALILLAVLAIILLLGGIGSCCYFQPQYSVYSARQDGMAELAKAESTRQVKVLEAKAAMDAAQDLAQAEVIRAQGVATANQIIGKSLAGNEAYLRYLWIQQLGTSTNRETIYVPTEANLPILEANRLQKQGAP